MRMLIYHLQLKESQEAKSDAENFAKYYERYT